MREKDKHVHIGASLLKKLNTPQVCMIERKLYHSIANGIDIDISMANEDFGEKEIFFAKEYFFGLNNIKRKELF